MDITTDEWIIIVFFFILINTGYTLLFNSNIGNFKYLGLIGPLFVAGLIGKLLIFEKKFKNMRE